MFNNGADINLYQINVHEGAVCDDVDVVSIPTKTINLAQTEISKYCTPSILTFTTSSGLVGSG